MNIYEFWYLIPHFSHKNCKCYQTKNLFSKNLKVIAALMWIFFAFNNSEYFLHYSAIVPFCKGHSLYSSYVHIGYVTHLLADL